MKFSLLVFFLLPFSFLDALELSPDLLEWANENPIVTVGIEDDFPPFSYVDEDGEPTGVSELIRRKLSTILPITLEVTSKGSFASQWEKFVDKQVMILPICASSPERAKTILFSKPFLSLTPIVVINKESSYQKMADIPRSAHIAVPRGYISLSSALRIVGSDNIVLVDSTLIGLKMVNEGKIEGFVTYLSAKDYAVQLHGFTHLRSLPITDAEPTQLGFCIDKDKPELVALLNVGIDALGRDYFNRLQAQWISSLNNTGIKTTNDKDTSVQKTVIISVFILVLLAFLLQRYSYLLARKFETVKFKLIYFSMLITMLFSSFVILDSYFENFKLRIIEDQKESFDIIKEAAIKSLDDWYFSRLEGIQKLVRAPFFQSRIEQLIAAHEGSNADLSSLSSNWLEAFFDARPYVRIKNRQYSIITIEGDILFSSRDIAEENSAILKHYPVLFERARQGQSVFIPTIDMGEKLNYPALSILEPIVGQNNDVIAIFVATFDARQGFSSLFNDIRLGLTVDSYAINLQGFLLSESRFIDQLHNDKTLPFDQSAILNMNVAQYKDNPIISDIRFKVSGRNLAGYTDYMDHTVVGQWSWIDKYNLVLVSELSTGDMYLEYTKLRQILFVVMTFFITLITAISLFMVIISHRAHQMSRLSQEKLAELVEKRTKALQVSETKNSLIVDSVADGILGLDALGGIVFFNRAAEHILGYKEVDILNRNYQEILYLNNSEQVNKDSLKVQILQCLNESKNLYVEKDYFCHVDAREIPVSYSLSIIMDKSSPFKAVITFQDISLRLLESERTRKLLTSLPVAILLINMDQKIVEINTATEQLLGYPNEEIIGQNLIRFIPENRQQEHKKIMKHFFVDPKYTRMGNDRQVTVQTKSGAIIEVEVIFSVMELGTEQMVVLSVLDITEENQTRKFLIEAKELADEASRSKSYFLANMSHEIRTPMNAIIGLSQLALQGKLEQKERNYVAKVNSAANNLLGIINDILDFSKIEADKLELEIDTFALSDLLDNFSTVIGLKAQEKGVDLQFNVDPDLPLFFIGDLLRLNQILINLGGNAIKFTNEGVIILNVSISEINDDHIKLLFSIKDTGIGIKADQLKDLFIAFSQADTSTTRKYGGTGLGLSISKRLVELMHGDIWAESVNSTGCEFFFTCWLTVDKDDQSQQIRETAQARLTGKRILIVDDNLTTLARLKELAEGFGCEVFTAQCGALALIIAEKLFHLDFALIDWDMPIMNGLDTCDALQEIDELVIEHIILTSACACEEICESDHIKYTDNVLSKPVTEQRLYQVLQSLLGYKFEADIQPEKVIDKQYFLAGIHILLVEDNELNQELATALLEAEGIIVSHAAQGEIAVSMVKANSYDCILMDIQMPVMGGYKATQLIRKFNKTIPILAMTANVMEGEKEKVETAGMNDYISKPINVEMMFTAIKHWIKNKGTKNVLPLPINTGDNNLLFAHFSKINKEAGLAVCNENSELYLKILADFSLSNQQFHEKFSAYRQAESWEELTILVHSLKGSAGNIGANVLFEQLNDLEVSCLKAERRSEIPPLLKIATSEFSAVDEEITILLALLAKQPKQDDSVQVVFSDLEVASKLDELQRLVDEFDTSAQEFAIELEKGLIDFQLKKLLINFIEQLKNFDFDRADKILSQLKSIN